MKIKVTKDAHHRINGAVSKSFVVSDEPYDVPAAIGNALIDRGCAEKFNPKANPTSKEQNNV